MKKKTLSILVLFFLTLNVKALSCDKTYLIQTSSSSGISEYIGCTDDYEEAKNLMREYPSTVTDVAAIYRGNNLVNARYAVANFSGKGSNILVYNNPNLSGTRYTYFHGDWGVDGAFIDYNPNKPSYKIKISGATGWLSTSKAKITPLSELYANTVTAKQIIRVRTEPKYDPTNSNQISSVQANTTWIYTEKVEADDYLWYKINFNGSYAYIAGKNLKTNSVYATEDAKYTFKTYYYVDKGNLIHYFWTTINNRQAQQSINLGVAPKNLEKNVRYYSFDGNYFYTSLEIMLDDYYNETYEHAVNYSKPYYNYYMYLPIHNLSAYTAEDLDTIIKNKKYTKAPDPNVVYYTIEGGWNNEVSRSGISALYGSGEQFIRAQEEYSVNAILMFGTAINESATGTSVLAFYKRNLFGQGAQDSCPISCANAYDSVYESIVGHAKLVGGSYSNPTTSLFYGSSYGNKGSGFGVSYASDPYWGEKTSRNAYQNDQLYGGQDYNVNTLGIKQTNEAIPLKKQPSDDAENIYLLKNNKSNLLVSNMSYIVTEKVKDEKGEYWYKVYADTSLDKNQNLSSSNYNSSYSYGYIKAKYLYISNNTETEINVDSYSIKRGEEVDLLKNVTAIDPEDGDLTNELTYEGTVDSNNVGEYKILYRVTDEQRYTTTKEIVITVLPSEAPIIDAKDIEVKQFKPFNPLDYVKAYDIYGKEITDITVEKNQVDINKVGVYEVTYKATYQNLSVTKTIKVTVLKDEIPTITASNRTIKLNDKFDYLAGVSASDLEDGDLTSKITYEGIVDVAKVGEYEITYTVKDSVNQSFSKKIKITVESIEYLKKDSDFYFNELSFKNSKLIISGYLAIKGTNNRESDNIDYALILKNNETLEDTIIPLERYLEGRPNRHYSDSKYDYSATWFKGNISLDNIKHGEYTLYIRARKDNLEAISLFRNIFLKEMSTKGTSGTKGFLFRNNNYLDSYPIELFVFENGLITNVENPKLSNMINGYKTMGFDKSKLTIKGTSYNIGVSYAAKEEVKRSIIFENKETLERFSFNIGSIIGTDIPLNVSDGFTRERGWFNSTIDIKSLPVGDYIIYIQTQVGKVNDFGELNDIFMKDLSKVTTTYDNKKVSFNINVSKRFRVEMHIENI